MILGIDAINIRGGGITYIKNLLLNEKASSFNKIIIWGNKEVLKYIKNNKKIEKINYSIFEKNFIIRIIWQFFFFNREIKKKDCSCVFYLSGYFFGNKYNKSAILLQNLLPFFPNFFEKYNLLLRVKFFFQRKIFISSFKKSDIVIFPSFFSKKIVNKFCRNFKSLVIYHGVESKFKINKKINYLKLIYLASLEPFKNHHNLFKAIYSIKKKQKIEIDLFGPNNQKYKNNLFNLINKINYNKKIIFYKGNRNFNYCYKNYNMFVYPTICESFGLPLIEAATSGMKVVCTNLLLFKELLGKNAVYFNPYSPKSIENAINISKKLRINLKNIQNIKKKFSIKQFSNKTFSTLYKISKTSS